jgi:hypothetical protein
MFSFYIAEVLYYLNKIRIIFQKFISIHHLWTLYMCRSLLTSSHSRHIVITDKHYEVSVASNGITSLPNFVITGQFV